MANMLERNKKVKAPQKTMQEHAEDALYREVWEDVKYYIDRLNRGEKIEEDIMDATYREFADIVGL